MRFEGELSSLDIDACAEGVEFSTSDRINLNGGAFK